MASPAAPNEPVTPASKLHLAATTTSGGMAPTATPVVDMATIEAAKENIVPLNSGRSASQLAALSSSTRSGLGVKLDLEHARFQAQIRAVDEYERNGAWPDGQDGLASEDVALLAEDPLDASHQYVRFIVANYPAGASAANKLVPVLEATTRKFLGDERYSNDPRYFRLWAHYAKNMEDPEDCYRFLFVKGVGEKLAALYEEYAKVLEAKNKRKQADQVYTLGINRRATPLDRLKRSYTDFQARMLVAPPVPSSPRPSEPSSSSAESRAVLGSSMSGAARPGASASAGTGVGPKGNGSAFAIFRDDAASSSSSPKDAGPNAEWDDYGTVKSRTRENNAEKKEWEGETLPVKGLTQPGASRPATAGGFKLEVYRDETATTASTSAHRLDDPDVFSRSSRPPSEAELLRSNPFRNYSARDLELIAKDPLEGLQVLPRATKSRSAATVGTKKMAAEGGKERKTSSKSASSAAAAAAAAGSKAATTSSTASSADGTRKSRYPPMMNPPDTSGLDTKPKERVAVNLREIYPAQGEEFSPEEVRARKRREKYEKEDVQRWNGWEWAEAFDKEMQATRRTRYTIDPESGWPVLYDVAGLPLYDFLPRPTPPASPAPSTPVRETAPQHDLLAPSPSTQETSFSRHTLDPHRPPSPTINTREANALADLLFAKTLDFTKVNSRSQAGGADHDSSSSDGDDDDDDSSDDSDEGDHGEQAPQYVGVGSESQFSTQGATQQSDVSDTPFVPFSQTRSEMGDDSAFFGSQQRPPASGSSSLNGYQHDLLGSLQEDNENESRINDENAPAPPPMQLFRDVAPASSASESVATAVPATPSTGGGFRPVRKTNSARAPLGAKSVTPLGAPPAQPSFGIFRDVVASADEAPEAPSVSDPSQSYSLLAGSYADQAEFEAPLRGDNSQEDLLTSEAMGEGMPFSNDGYDLGRRVPGQPSRYAPFVAQMTPIVERTLEFTNATSLSASQRSRRESYYPTGAATTTLQEEDEDEEEPSTEEDDDDENHDRAFVASFAQPSFVQQQQQQPLPARGEEHGQALALGGSSTTTSDSENSSESDSDSDSDEDVIDLAAQSVPQLVASPRDPVPARSSLGHDGSYDASGSPSLPEGLTITGNQTKMDTEMQVEDSATTRQSLAVAPVNPYSDATLDRLVAGSKVFEHPEVRDLMQQTSGRFDVLQRQAKKREKSKGGRDRTGTIDEAWDLELAGETFSVREKLGEGSFGAVFRVAFSPNLDDDEDFDVDDDEELSLAVKVEKPTNLWEFHVLTQLHARLPTRVRDSIVSPHRLYAFADESFLFLGYCDQGSLLDAVNRANDSGVAASATGSASQGFDELLAMFFVVELLRVVEGLHSSGFIHGDLKIDNCLLRLEDVPGGARAWSPVYDPSGQGGWSCKGVKVIDFGRTIDTTAFAAGQTFKSHLEVGQFDCAEVKEGRPWRYEPDYFGVASIAFNILFGRYIETKQVPIDEARPDGVQKYTLVHTWRRYYQVELWTKAFDMLLNPHNVHEDGSLPITNELAAVRCEMEEYLRVHGEKNGKSLRGLIRKLEIASMSR